jgi:DNA mismatch repair protein MutL
MKTLSRGSINLLSSGQVITGVLSAIKELLENALDASAKTIELRIEDLGLRSITVTDDGSGISREGRHTCALQYTTSKIVSIEDLTNDLTTFGFRGEALHSLCCVSDVTITTRCSDEAVAERLTFDHEGNVVKSEQCAAPIGTAVVVANLLSCFPVRVREQRATFSVESVKSMLSKYFLAAPTVRFVVDAGAHLSTRRPPLTTIMQAVALEFGTHVAASLVERTAEGFSGDIRIRVKGIVPAATCDWKVASTGRTQTKQVLLVNGRPVHNSVIEKRINEACWKRFGSLPKRMPIFVVCVDFFRETQFCSAMMDVNLEPSKSRIVFSDTNVVMKLIDEIMSFEQPQLKFRAITAWPSRSLNVSRPEVHVEDLGMTAIWKDAGTFDDYSLFHVRDVSDRSILVAVDTRGVFESYGVSRAEVGRTAQSELIGVYWEHLMEQHRQKPRVFPLIELH